MIKIIQEQDIDKHSRDFQEMFTQKVEIEMHPEASVYDAFKAIGRILNMSGYTVTYQSYIDFAKAAEENGYFLKDIVK